MKTLFAIGLVLITMMSACGGGKLLPDCSYMGEGSTFCRAPDDHQTYGGYCCPSDFPYCGMPETNCPVDACCSDPPK